MKAVEMFSERNEKKVKILWKQLKCQLNKDGSSWCELWVVKLAGISAEVEVLQCALEMPFEV